MSRATLKAIQRSIDLATGMVERAGRHGKSVGPYVCATVELRVEDLRAVLALAREAEELRAALVTIEKYDPDDDEKFLEPGSADQCVAEWLDAVDRLKRIARAALAPLPARKPKKPKPPAKYEPDPFVEGILARDVAPLPARTDFERLFTPAERRKMARGKRPKRGGKAGR